MIPADHLLRRIDVFATGVLGDLHEQLSPIRLQRLHRSDRWISGCVAAQYDLS
jgi:hypothetical protein